MATIFEEYGSTREQMEEYIILRDGGIPVGLTDEELFELYSGQDIETYRKNKKLREVEERKQIIKNDKSLVIKDNTEGNQFSKYFSELVLCFILKPSNKCIVKIIPIDDVESLIDEFEFVKKLSKNTLLFANTHSRRRRERSLSNDSLITISKMEEMNQTLPRYRRQPTGDHQERWHNYETVKNSLKK